MAKKNNIKITIKTDGTVEGTSLVFNGADVTKEMNVRYISFSADANPYLMSEDETRQVYLSWAVLEKDDDGMEKMVHYRYNPQDNKLTKGVGKKIGDSAPIEFDNDSDRRVYDATEVLPKLEKRVEIVDAAKVKDEGQYKCECIDCGHKMTTDQHCKDVKCSECGGTMRREDRPGPGQDK